MGLPCRFMRVVRRVGAAAVAVAFAALLGGCAPQVQPPPPKPSPSSSPVFASDEEALAAATKAYAAYQHASDSVAHDSGAGVERLREVVTGSAYANEQKVFESFHNRGLTGVGQSSFDNVSLQSYDRVTSEVVLYLCVDLSHTDIVDADHASTVSKDRPTRFPFEVTFGPTKDGSKTLWITGSESWTGANFC
jgi:hypothetical protein